MMGARWWARLRGLLHGLRLMDDAGRWVIEGQVLGCAYPRRAAALAALAGQGIGLVVNLHQRPHPPSSLTAHGLRELHEPVADFTAPAPEQIERVVAAVSAALAAGERVAVHCGAGLGRTGTILACLLVARGQAADAAIAAVRASRPGSIETPDQVQAVHHYAARQANA